MTWLYCGAFYGQLYMVSNTYQHGAIDVIGGYAEPRSNQTERARFRAAARRHAPPLAWIGRNTPPLFCIHLVVLNVAPWSVLIT